jgi:hypothetical protein
MECWASGAVIECTPEAARGVRPDVEVIVEWQFGSVGSADGRRRSQPQPVFNSSNAQQNMPTVRRLAEFAR